MNIAHVASFSHCPLVRNFETHVLLLRGSRLSRALVSVARISSIGHSSVWETKGVPANICISSVANIELMQHDSRGKKTAILVRQA